MKRQSKREQAAEQRRAADLTGQAVGRDDILYDHEDLPRPPATSMHSMTAGKVVLDDPTAFKFQPGAALEFRDAGGNKILSPNANLLVNPKAYESFVSEESGIRLIDIFPNGLVVHLRNGEVVGISEP